jgi:DnaJ-class molecular chaperone
MIKDYYDILVLKKDASDEEIAQSYKKMVLKWHPKFAK